MSDYSPPKSRSLTKTKKMLSYLPPEVITQILSRLPVESVVKCTAVCKSWYALIKHPSFISAHLQEAASLQDDLLLLCYPNEDLKFVYHLHRDNDAFEECKQLPLPSDRFGDCFIVGACNGLICLLDVEGDAWNVILWNPSLHRHFILPEPDLPRAIKSYFFHTLGFGFDSVSNDFKVLLIVPDGDNEDMDAAWLFSLRRRSWKRLTEVSPVQSFYEVGKKVFANGALHYGLFSNMILAFDMSAEKFFVINIPEALVPFVRLCLIECEESIALVNRGSSHDQLWVMKEYGVDSSWTKVFHSIDENGELVFGTDLLEILAIRKKGKVFLNMRGEHRHEYKLAVLDLDCHQQDQKQQRLKHLGGPNSLQYSYFGSYVESLVFLDKGEEDVVVDGV